MNDIVFIHENDTTKKIDHKFPHINNNKLELIFSNSHSRSFISLNAIQDSGNCVVLYCIVSIFKQIDKSGPDFCASRLISHNGGQSRREPIEPNKTFLPTTKPLL